MKSPADIGAALARQWESGEGRFRLMLSPSEWPLRVSIGLPSPARFESSTADVRAHVARWRDVRVGEVEWVEKKYRGGAEAIALPSAWVLPDMESVALACPAGHVQVESRRLQRLLEAAPGMFAPLLARRRALWRDRPDEATLLACAMAMQLEPGCAAGRPLRALSVVGTDSKFIERNRSLLTALLDARFDNQASGLGLPGLLGSTDEADHWLLVVALDDGMLPLRQIRARASDLAREGLSAQRILLVENERCVHLLPRLPGTLAVLGSGLDLGWLQAGWLADRDVAYWGDMDTWGLRMLGRARVALPGIQRLLMDRLLFDQHAQMAVAEPSPSDPAASQGLLEDEQAFDAYLRALPRGRVEQERLPVEAVEPVLRAWAEGANILR